MRMKKDEEGKEANACPCTFPIANVLAFPRYNVPTTIRYNIPITSL